MDPKQLSFYETNHSKEARGADDWDPDWIQYSFAAVFACNNSKCKEVVTCCGDGRVDGNQYEDQNGDVDIEYHEVFFPKYFSYPLDVFPIPASCPKEIQDEVRKSFQIFMADPSSAANHIRTAIEHLMTFLKVKRFDKNKGKTLVNISLHRRIIIYGTKKKAVADKLLAIKWLGNAGSHPGGITKDDMLDAYDILEHVLSPIFDPTHRDIDAIVDGINRNEGPLQKKHTTRGRK